MNLADVENLLGIENDMDMQMLYILASIHFSFRSCISRHIWHNDLAMGSTLC